MTRPALTGLTLDTGALLALDHPPKARHILARLADARALGVGLCVPVGVVAQAWRSPGQVRLSRLIKLPEVEIAILTLPVARSLGALCAQTGHDDVIDVHVAWCARERGHAVVTSDPADIARVDPTLTLITV
jgi:hypothetical protein